MTPVMRMNMEKCLVNNYLLKHGMDYFGKRDYIYLDMMGTDDVTKRAAPTDSSETYLFGKLFRIMNLLFKLRGNQYTH